MTGRDRTQSEHDAYGLPTRTIRVVFGRERMEAEMGSGTAAHAWVLQYAGFDDDEVERTMRERRAVNL